MAGYTHSAFRRLVAELGGCGALWTEMLSAHRIPSENPLKSPWLRKRPIERNVFYQLMIRPGDPVDIIMAKLAEHGVEAVDVNLACDAPEVRSCQAGSGLFADLKSLCLLAKECRRYWKGILTAKIRLGAHTPDWQESLAERIRLLEDSGFDALIVHPRFFREKFKRVARHEYIPWIATITKMPIIASGDISGPEDVKNKADHLRAACAIMIGRHAICRPWLFAAWDKPFSVDPAEIWNRICNYIEEDFPPEVAIRRIQMFTKYYSANFAFGHILMIEVSNARTISEIRERAAAFFASGPRPVTCPVVAGL